MFLVNTQGHDSPQASNKPLKALITLVGALIYFTVGSLFWVTLYNKGKYHHEDLRV